VGPIRHSLKNEDIIPSLQSHISEFNLACLLLAMSVKHLQALRLHYLSSL